MEHYQEMSFLNLHLSLQACLFYILQTKEEGMSKKYQNLDRISGLLKLCDFKSGLNLKIASLLWLLNSNSRNLLSVSDRNQLTKPISIPRPRVERRASPQMVEAVLGQELVLHCRFEANPMQGSQVSCQQTTVLEKCCWVNFYSVIHEVRTRFFSH